ncbi:MAG TPA: hypothetical protein VFS40_15695 [Gemmatimonadales bacterium]|nr:hypothetical protein [Gemmatimonadales bacterium]
MTAHALDLSVVVPVVERPEPLGSLYEEFAAPLREAGYRFEFIFVVRQGWARLAGSLEELQQRGEPVRVLMVGQGVSETHLHKVAAAAARGRIVATVPAYRQVVAAAVPALVQAVEAGADFAVARRWPRHDSLINRLQTRVLHLAIGRLAGGKLHDVGSGVRAMRPAVLDEVRVYGDFVRFLPLFALREGFTVAEVDSQVHPAAHAGRVYGPGVYLRRLIDVLGLSFLLRFTDKPLRFFGLVGGALGAVGGLILMLLLLQREFADRSVADRPVLLLGVLLVTLGAQSIALGLVGEMIVHLHASRRPLYRLRARDENGRLRPPRRRADDLLPPLVSDAEPLLREHTR